MLAVNFGSYLKVTIFRLRILFSGMKQTSGLGEFMAEETENYLPPIVC
jgi:hypothetical protein